MDVWMHGVGAPLVHILEKFGLAEQALRNVNARQQKKLRKKDPFHHYIPTEHDIIVATYAKRH